MICFARITFSCQTRNFRWSKRRWISSNSMDTSPSKVMRNAEFQTIHSETVNIPKHGRLLVRSPFNLHLTPVHEKDFPRLDKAFFTIYGDSGFKFSKETWNKFFQFSTFFDHENRTLRVLGEFTELGEKQLSKEAHTLEVYCQIPPNYELDVHCSDNNNVNIEQFQSPRVHIQTKRGECSLTNVSANSLVVHSQSGNINCKGQLLGTIDLSTEREGEIKASKLQGAFVRLSVENSNILVKSIYSENFTMKGKRGQFLVGNLQGNGSIDLKSGAIKLGSVDGNVSLQCEQGDIDVYFASTDLSKVRAQDGNVKLSVIDTLNARLNLSGRRVQIDEEIEHFHRETTIKNGVVQVQGYITDESSSSSITVNALDGTVRFNVRDWFSTLKLDKHVDH